MVSAVEMAVNPKKRVFLALVLFSAIMTAVLLFFAWKVTYLGFEAISQFLPAGYAAAENFIFLVLESDQFSVPLCGGPGTYPEHSQGKGGTEFCGGE